MEYRGFKSIIQFDKKENLFTGKVIGTEIHFEGKTEEQAKRNGRRAIDAFIDFRNGVR